MDSYDRLIDKTLFEMKFNYYDNALREYSKDNIWFQSYNQLKYGIEDTCQYSYLKNVNKIICMKVYYIQWIRIKHYLN